MKEALPIIEAYAAAFIETACRKGVDERIEEDLLLVRNCFSKMPELLRRLRMPSLSANDRYRILDSALGSKVDPLTLRLFEILVRRDRLELLPDMHDAVRRERERRDGVVRVTVCSAYPMDDTLRSAVEANTRLRYGGRCVVEYVVDRGLVAGLRVKRGGREIDCSVRAGLDRLRRHLLCGCRESVNFYDGNTV